jgi:hypothetical protein
MDKAKFVAWVLQAYPEDAAGNRPTQSQVEKLAAKLGRVKKDADPATIDNVKAELKRFALGIQKLNEALLDGSYDRRYVPAFGKFSGVGLRHDSYEEPGYRIWAAREHVKRRELVV